MSVKKKFASSSAWVAFGNGIDNGVQFIVFAVLAQLLSVAEIGLVAYVMVIVDLLRVVAAAGTSEAIIRRAGWDELFSATAFWVNVAIGLATATLSVPVVAVCMYSYSYSESEVYAVLSLFTLVTIDSARAVHVAKLRKEFNFRSIALRTLGSGVVSGVIAVVVAYFGGGIWALTVQRLVYSIATTLQTWQAAKWMPMFTFDRSELRNLLIFSFKVVGARIVDVAILKLPDFIIGLMLGPTQLGYFKVGSRALDALFQLVIKPVQFATLPALSAAARSGRLSQAVERMTRFFALVICPAMFGSAALASDLISILFGTRYEQSAAIMQILAVSALPASISFFVGPALIVRNKTGSMFVLSWIQLVMTATTLLMFTPFGLAAAAWSVVAGQYIWLPICIYVLSRNFEITPTKIAVAVFKPFCAALIMFLCLMVVGGALTHHYTIVRLIVVIMSGVAIYTVVLRILFRDVLSNFISETKDLFSQIVRK